MGINFNDRDIKTDDKFVWFPSPRGDKFQPEWISVKDKLPEFPSPHGDKFQLSIDYKSASPAALFPSPRGDKFQQTARQLVGSMYRFRPLTGIDFNVSESVIASNFQRFPSPHGDKFQLGLGLKQFYQSGFPSPRGDIFQQLVKWNLSTRKARFRPLTGLNFNFLKKLEAEIWYGFRPLSGINFNGLKQFYQSNKQTFPSPLGDKFQLLQFLSQFFDS